MTIYDAEHDYRNAEFATNWARGLCAWAVRELSLSITQPIEYVALEDALEAYERAERGAWEELEYREREARAVVRQGRCSTPSRYL